MEDSIPEYILSEKEFVKKVEIMHYLKKRIDIFFDNSVVFKALIVKLFIETMGLDVDENLAVTAMLLCQCKKISNAKDLNTIESYAKQGAEYLESLGFDKEFCTICEQHNRYSNSMPRRKESDILELANQFGGMLLDRPERIAFPIDEAIAILENRNLKDVQNIYLEKFKEFIDIAKEINIWLIIINKAIYLF